MAYDGKRIMGRIPKTQVLPIQPKNPGNALVNKMRGGKK